MSQWTKILFFFIWREKSELLKYYITWQIIIMNGYIVYAEVQHKLKMSVHSHDGISKQK